MLMEVLRRYQSILVGLVAVASIWLAGCGSSDDPPEGAGPGGVPFQRLAWSPRDLETGAAAASEAPVVLGKLEVENRVAPWEEFATEKKRTAKFLVEQGGALRRRDARVLNARREEKSIRAAIPPGAEGFDQVVAEITCDNGRFEDVHMEFFAGDDLVALSDTIRLSTGQVLRPVVFRAPDLRRAERRPDSLRLVFKGYARLAVIASLAFMQRPGELLASPTSGTGEARFAGGVFRRSVAVNTKIRSQAACELDGNSAVSLFVAVDPELARRSERLTFRFELSDASGAAPETQQLVLGVEDGWKNVLLGSEEPRRGPCNLSVQTESNMDGGVGIGLVGEACVRRMRADPDAPSPLVLLITSDTHRGDHLGIVNSDSPVQTPHLDALARRGVLFEDCYSQTNVTNPSHIALMTGTHPRDTGILNNRTRLVPRAETLAEQFARAGYQTLAVTSAFHLLDSRSGLGQGFDRMEGPAGDYRDGEVSVRTLLSWIDDDLGAPTFAWLHLFDAHSPYAPPAPYDRKYYTGDDPFQGPDPDIPERVLIFDLKGLKDINYPYTQYRGEVDYLDGALGELLRRPRVQRGITAFTADHGESFGRHGIWWTHDGLFPDTVQIPMILAWPGAPAGSRFSAPIQQIDLGRTLLDLAGLESASFEGRGLDWAWESPEASSPRFLLSAHAISASLEADGWQFILELKPNFPDTSEEPRVFGQASLYYRPEDPYCEKDLLSEELPRARKMRARLIEWLTEPRPSSLGESARTTSRDEQMLAALGYGGGEEAAPSLKLWDPERWAGSDWQTDPWRVMFEEDE